MILLKANSDASNAIKRREGDYFTSKIFYNFYKNTKNREFQPTDGYTIGIGQGFIIYYQIYHILIIEFLDLIIMNIKKILLDLLNIK